MSSSFVKEFIKRGSDNVLILMIKKAQVNTKILNYVFRKSPPCLRPAKAGLRADRQGREGGLLTFSVNSLKFCLMCVNLYEIYDEV